MEAMSSDERSHSGVISAEPGWRVLLTDDTRSWMAPVVAWFWSSDEHGRRLTEMVPLIPWEGALERAESVANQMGNADAWRVDTLLAPGCDHTTAAEFADGWVEVSVDESGDAREQSSFVSSVVVYEAGGVKITANQFSPQTQRGLSTDGARIPKDDEREP